MNFRADVQSYRGSQFLLHAWALTETYEKVGEAFRCFNNLLQVTQEAWRGVKLRCPKITQVLWPLDQLPFLLSGRHFLLLWTWFSWWDALAYDNAFPTSGSNASSICAAIGWLGREQCVTDHQPKSAAVVGNLPLLTWVSILQHPVGVIAVAGQLQIKGKCSLPFLRPAAPPAAVQRGRMEYQQDCEGHQVPSTSCLL